MRREAALRIVPDAIDDARGVRRGIGRSRAAAAVLFIMRTYAIFVHLSWGVILHRPIFNHLDEVRHWLADHDEDVLPP